MTDLERYTLYAALWIAVAWLPYILDRIMVRGLLGAMGNPGPHLAPQSEWAQRAMRAHTVAVESFVAFAPLAVLAAIRMPADPYPGVLAMTYFFALLAHYIVYALGIPVLRTLAFAIAALSSVAMALRLLGAI
ncbi:MAPEG family protein [Roseovarius salinarum]|uniref:MAPEG family protein n=1 Tax=Roseovarius salinarum TaxID=1981892 RepID=UPI000C3237DE|nr:MAPEG family protein [Roseovarius salinarum]